MKFSPLLSELIQALTCLPGVGNKSAQRMAFHLLERNRTGAIDLSNVLHNAMEHIHHCKRCRTFTEDELCDICRHPEREASGLLCIVESPQDEEIGLTELETRLAAGGINEVILATNPTVEGEATAHYIAQLCTSHNVDASRIAHGVPVGGELEYIDGNTLTHAFSGRRKL